MDFEWDKAKCESNLAKHEIDFFDAITIWEGAVIDPLVARQIEQEERYLALGAIGDAAFIIGVVYTLRGTTRRIISARRARRHERKSYQDKFGQGI